MPEGQFLGERGYFLYNSDAEVDYVIQTDATLGNLPQAGLVEADEDNAENVAFKPARLQPRGVHWQGVLNGRTVRKFIVCSLESEIYKASGSNPLTVDGVQGVTTGRRGEVFSFPLLRKPTAGPPAPTP